MSHATITLPDTHAMGATLALQIMIDMPTLCDLLSELRATDTDVLRWAVAVVTGDLNHVEERHDDSTATRSAMIMKLVNIWVEVTGR